MPSLLTNFWTCNFWNTIIGLIVDWDSIYLWSSNDREKLIKIKSYFFLGFVVRSWFSLLPLVFISYSTEVKISWLKRRSNRLKVVKKRRKNNTSQGKWISQEVSFHLFIFFNSYPNAYILLPRGLQRRLGSLWWYIKQKRTLKGRAAWYISLSTIQMRVRRKFG